MKQGFYGFFRVRCGLGGSSPNASRYARSIASLASTDHLIFFSRRNLSSLSRISCETRQLGTVTSCIFGFVFAMRAGRMHASGKDGQNAGSFVALGVFGNARDGAPLGSLPMVDFLGGIGGSNVSTDVRAVDRRVSGRS